MSTIINYLPLLSIVLSTCLLIGGYIAFRSGYSKQSGEIQDRNIAALKMQNELLEKDSKECKENIRHLRRVVATIRYGMEQQGWSIQVNGETITLMQGQAKRVRSVTIQTNNPHVEKQLGQLESGIEEGEEENNGTDKP